VTELDRASLDRLLPATPGPAGWNDVLSRVHSRRRRRRRRVVALAAAALVVIVGTTSAFGTVRDLVFGTERTAWGSAPAWSPDGQRIAYTVHRYPPSSGPSEVYLMNAYGTEPRNLTETWGPDVFPVWSPDWRKILFLRNPCTSVRRACRGITQIYVMNTDGSGRRRLARGGTLRTLFSGQFHYRSDSAPAWSPDGRRVAFASDRAGNAEVYVMNADGSGQRNLTHSPGFDSDPVWSPDGRKIAFVSKAFPQRPGDIYVVNADGGGLRNLTAGPGGGESPSWSPDGRTIAFRSLRDGNGEIYVMNADGSGLRRLTRNAASDYGPLWSPNGRKILFVRVRDGNSDIFVIDTGGGALRNLTRHTAEDGAPAWSPDGRKIVFVSKRDGKGEIYVMNADGSGLRRLTQLRG
jgi:Tol biopolymer transport system component